MHRQRAYSSHLCRKGASLPPHSSASCAYDPPSPPALPPLRVCHPRWFTRTKCSHARRVDMHVLCPTWPDVFDFRQANQAGVNTSAGFKELPPGFRYESSHPAMPFLRGAWQSSTSRQLFSGGAGSGASMHFHGYAYNVLFFGSKRWLLLPPRYAAISAAKVHEP